MAGAPVDLGPQLRDSALQFELPRLRGRRCTVNLIPWNPSPELPYLRPSPGGPEAFRDALASRGVVATVRWSRGLDGDTACGQLRHRHAAGS